METVVKELKSIVEAYSQKFSPTKWSRKEVVGHLIDSGQNNLRRFIVGQYENEPHIVYQQDFWVKANSYQNQNRQNVIDLWKLVNLQICAVLSSMPKENYARNCNTGSLHTIEWLAADYVKHLKHHINQVIAGSFDIVYP